MRPFLLRALMLVLVAEPALHAQPQATPAADQPALHKRSAHAHTDEDEEPVPDQTGLQRGRTMLTADAWGEYRLGGPGDVIEIDYEDRRLTGYISRQGDGDFDKGAALTYFFDRSTINGTHVTFRTRAVHGVWYSFSGEILPGSDGAYLFQGTLSEHSREQGLEQPRRISLRKTPAFGGAR